MDKPNVVQASSFEDAVFAGTKRSKQCTFIIVEGQSAKLFVVT
ncbi:DNA topoisomerase II [Corchorus olitorius]|uniref:DNA topoisomerase II n=1 Tax=Corchorus olitorius TaxID=93759 RepID=A0A1R3J4B4_9ROSI|nr:DNA topoisomerase II [Corchorus olitorius]